MKYFCAVLFISLLSGCDPLKSEKFAFAGHNNTSVRSVELIIQSTLRSGAIVTSKPFEGELRVRRDYGDPTSSYEDFVPVSIDAIDPSIEKSIAPSVECDISRSRVNSIFVRENSGRRYIDFGDKW